jgi:AraC-like DNA-binding protein
MSSLPSPIDISQQNSLPGKPEVCKPFLAREEHCNPHTCAWERQYDRPGIGVVLSGRFEYRSQTGLVIGVPGTIVFGNAGEFFHVTHFDGLDIRRLVVWYDSAFFEMVSKACGLREPRFPAVALPPGRAATAMFAQMRDLARGWNDSDDVAFRLAESALTISPEDHSGQVISNRDRQRVLSAVNYIEHAFCDTCSVDTLANVSGLSRYHFMRLFKAVTGQSANQYVINTRLRAAAARITETGAPVSEIAFDVGFNDISHFNTCFRMMFGRTPSQMRKLARAA